MLLKKDEEREREKRRIIVEYIKRWNDLQPQEQRS